jgi:hypothetical protein
MTTTEENIHTPVTLDLSEYDVKEIFAKLEAIKNLAQIYSPVSTITTHSETRWCIALAIKAEADGILRTLRVAGLEEVK